MTLPSVKRALRRQVQAALQAITPESIASQSQNVLHEILRSPTYQASRSLSVYLPTVHSEIQTFELIRHALSAGKRVFVPFIGAGSGEDMRMLRLYSDDFPDGTEKAGVGHDGWERDRWGIPVLPTERNVKRGPREDASTTTEPLDLIFLPGVAFSPTPSSPLFSRLGHGKGYYDKYISSYASFCQANDKLPPRLVGLALKEQWLKEGEVPTGEWDVGLDEVLIG